MNIDGHEHPDTTPDVVITLIPCPDHAAAHHVQMEGNLDIHLIGALLLRALSGWHEEWHAEHDETCGEHLTHVLHTLNGDQPTPGEIADAAERLIAEATATARTAAEKPTEPAAPVVVGVNTDAQCGTCPRLLSIGADVRLPLDTPYPDYFTLRTRLAGAFGWTTTEPGTGPMSLWRCPDCTREGDGE